jgi:hypothetical protein
MLCERAVVGVIDGAEKSLEVGRKGLRRSRGMSRAEHGRLHVHGGRVEVVEGEERGGRASGNRARNAN